MLDLDATVWGPHYWFFLHTAAMTYPLTPNDGVKKKFYEFIQNMPLFIPDTAMANGFQRMIDTYPLTPYLDSRDSLVRWTHFIHNKMNKRLGQKQVSITKFYEEYHAQYKPRDVKYVEYAKTKRNVLYAAIVGALFCGIVYLNSRRVV